MTSTKDLFTGEEDRSRQKEIKDPFAEKKKNLKTGKVIPDACR